MMVIQTIVLYKMKFVNDSFLNPDFVYIKRNFKLLTNCFSNFAVILPIKLTHMIITCKEKEIRRKKSCTLYFILVCLTQHITSSSQSKD